MPAPRGIAQSAQSTQPPRAARKSFLRDSPAIRPKQFQTKRNPLMSIGSLTVITTSAPTPSSTQPASPHALVTPKRIKPITPKRVLRTRPAQTPNRTPTPSHKPPLQRGPPTRGQKIALKFPIRQKPVQHKASPHTVHTLAHPPPLLHVTRRTTPKLGHPPHLLLTLGRNKTSTTTSTAPPRPPRSLLRTLPKRRTIPGPPTPHPQPATKKAGRTS